MRHFVSKDTELLNHKDPNELKFLLYDMFITGIDLDDISIRTGVPSDEIENCFAEVDLKDFLIS